MLPNFVPSRLALDHPALRALVYRDSVDVIHNCQRCGAGRQD